MKYELIRDLVDPVQQVHPTSLGMEWIRYVDISSIDRERKCIDSPAVVATSAAPSRARQVVEEGDVLVSTVRPNLNAVALVPSEYTGAIASTGFCVLRPKPARILPKYLFYFMQTRQVVSYLAGVATGASYPAITDDNVLDIHIPAVSLSDQNRTANLMERSDRLRQRRSYTLGMVDTFLPGAFAELFGDPIRNERGWPLGQLGAQLKFMTSGSRGWAAHYADSGDVFLRIQNVGYGRLLMDDVARVHAPSGAEAERTRVLPGDVLLSITADLGRSASIPPGFPTAFVNQHLAILRPQDMDPVFLASLLSCDCAKSAWRALDRDAVKSGLNFDDIRGFQVILPPLQLQQKYAEVVRVHERLRAVQCEALRQTEQLFQALLEDSFHDAEVVQVG